jgi:hypothetical protein
MEIRALADHPRGRAAALSLLARIRLRVWPLCRIDLSCSGEAAAAAKATGGLVHQVK